MDAVQLGTVECSGTTYEHSLQPHGRGRYRWMMRFAPSEHRPEPGEWESLGKIGGLDYLMSLVAEEVVRRASSWHPADALLPYIETVHAKAEAEAVARAEQLREERERLARREEVRAERRRLAKELRTKAARISVRTTLGIRQVDAFESAGLAIHRKPSSYESTWTVTHVHSGLSIASDITTRQEAREIMARILASDLDWTMPESVLKKNEGYAQAVAKARGELYE